MANRSNILKYCLLLAAFFPAYCFGQFSVSGRILNQADTKPVANASAFFNNATIGDKTTADGTFSLHNVKPGKYQLIVSIVGFETYDQAVTVNKDITLPDIIIFPKTISLNEVTIKPDANRERNYNWFKREFLGTTELSGQCRILNPEVLDLNYDEATGVLTASSTDFLEVSNLGLGYKLKYRLSRFMMNNKNIRNVTVSYAGTALFEEIKGKPSQENEWKKTRAEVYANSETHFLRAALNNHLQEEGFLVQQFAIYANPQRPPDSLIDAKIRSLKGGKGAAADSLAVWVKRSKMKKVLQKLMPYALTSPEIVKPTTEAGTYALNCENDALYVTYDKNRRFRLRENANNIFDATNTENTLVTFNTPNAFFDDNGWLNDPGSLTFNGVWGRNRIAGLLPLDYEMTSNKTFVADTALTGILSKLEVPSTDNTSEKVYLHVDGQNYGIKDTIWFKAYTVTGDRHQLSALSKVLYVELISPKDSVVQRQLLPLNSGVTWAGLPLNVSYSPRNYRIRAYTRWMQNNGEECFFNTMVQIGGIAPAGNKTGQTPKTPDVQFFPEGGELVAGARSRLGVKAVDGNGMGEDVSGVVTDNEGNTVGEFTTQHAGMGVFALLPQAGKIYAAKITAKGLPGFTVALPKVQEKGFVLSVNENTDSLQVVIAANDRLLAEKKDSSFYLVAQTNGKIYYTARGSINKPRFLASVDKKRFPTGIARFTLFSAEGLPVNERIAFIRNDDTIKINAVPSPSIITAGQKVSININTTTGGQMTPGSYSVAVIDEKLAAIDEPAESTIINNLLLTSELSGHIEDPNYYFTNVNDKVNANLDLLMLTQGYHKFNWKAVLSGEKASIVYQPEKALHLEGTVKTKDGSAVANGNINLLATSENFTADTTTDANGKFTFNNLDLKDSTKIVLQARSVKNSKDVFIRIDDGEYPKVTHEEVFNEYFAMVSQAQLTLQKDNYIAYLSAKKQDSVSKAHHLKEVVIKARKSFTPELEYSSNITGPGHADQVILGKDLELHGCINLKDCLSYKMNGVILKGGKFYTVRSMARMSGPPMVVIMNGVEVPLETLENISPTETYAVEVLRSGPNLAIYGLNASGGAIVLTLKKGFTKEELAANKVVPQGLTTMLFKGYDKMREFYAPKYRTTQTAAITNNKATVYWKPNILTDKDGKASFEYFNSDTKGTYRMVVEGIDDNGNLGRLVYRYKVE